MPRLPLIEDLTKGPIPPGSNILVEFDPTSQWYNASISISAGWMKDHGKVSYVAAGHPPENVRSGLNRVGVDARELESDGRLVIWDWYTVTLGQKSKEKFAMESLKVSDLSIYFAKDFIQRAPTPELLIVLDDVSVLERFNDEKAWVEFALTRGIPSARAQQARGIIGIIKGVHSDWAYRRLEAAMDGVVEFSVKEVGEETQNAIRIRTMNNVGFDSKWRPLRISENFEITLEK